MRNIFFKVFAISALLIFAQKSFSQIVISGPTCIVPGTVYQYVISGNWDSTSTVQVCVTAGVIADSSNDNTCTPSLNAINKVLVIWDDSASDVGSIIVTSSKGNASLNVNFTQALLPGLIDSASKVQIIDSSTIPASITCGVDSGGSCSPSYSHQWQSSSDMVTWADIPSATGESLNIDSALTRSTFYRRKVTEMTSGSIGYSDPASVLIILPPTDTTTQTDSITNNHSTGFNARQSKMIKRVTFYYSNAFALTPEQWIVRKKYFNESSFAETTEE